MPVPKHKDTYKLNEMIDLDTYKQHKQHHRQKHHQQHHQQHQQQHQQHHQQHQQQGCPVQ